MMRLLFRSSVAASAALALVAAIAPAQAGAGDEGNVVATSPGGSGQTAMKAREKRFCVMADSSASRLPVKICKTKKEWLAEGVDITADH